MKSVTISVRVAEADADFIAGLEVPGASTPSDKLRAIIAEARTLRQGLPPGPEAYARALAQAQALVGPARQRWRDLERRHRPHSELVGALGQWLPEAVALLAAGAAPAQGRAGSPAGGAGTGDVDGEGGDDSSGKSPNTAASLREVERALADHVFALIETVLRLGVTPTCRGCDERVVADRLGRVLEITRLIEAAQPAQEDRP